MTNNLPKSKKSLNEWHDVGISPKTPYAMLDLLTDNGILHGWWTGFCFDGLHVTCNTVVKMWRINREDRV